MITNTDQAAEVVDEILYDYELLFNNQAEFVANYPDNYLEQTFDIMDSSTHITQSKVG